MTPHRNSFYIINTNHHQIRFRTVLFTQTVPLYSVLLDELIIGADCKYQYCLYFGHVRCYQNLFTAFTCTRETKFFNVNLMIA